MKNFFKKSGKRLGSAKGRRYDLPLNSEGGTGFLILLIGLMTFLAVMALATSVILGSMTQRWSSGLENKVTIEIPAERPSGNLRTPADIVELKQAAAQKLSKLAYVKQVEVLAEDEIRELIEPWMGKEIVLQDIPLPGLVSVELHLSNGEVLRDLQQQMDSITAGLRVDAHEDWLGDLLRLIGALQFAAAAVALIIGVTTVSAISGAIRMRMALHHAEIELLHMMGARDEYITRQLQRHALLLGLKGSVAGAVFALSIMAAIGFISGHTAAALLPGFEIVPWHIAALIAVPGAVCLIAAATARFTVMRSLALMP